MIAQIVNFIILLVVLRLLLYRPILNAMDERERRIAQRIASAEETRAKAEEIEADYIEKRSKIEREKDAILAEARDKAKERAGQMLTEAREEIERKKGQWLETLHRDRDNFVKTLDREASTRVLATSEKALRDLADEGLNSRIAGKFVGRLKGLPEGEIAEFRSALRDSGGKLALISAFELDEQSMKNLAISIKERFGEIAIDWQIDSGKIGGIELRAGGKKLEWSIEDYIDELKEAIRAAFDEATPKTTDKAKAEDE